MRRCVELARRAIGQTRPNPLVGCVLVATDGHVLGEGFHHRAGQNHAEVEALEAASKHGHDVRGSTAFVNLEPCNHFGKTPPCAQALIRANVRRVVIGMTDPDPRVSGSGIQTLRAAGIAVKLGVEQDLCLELNESFVHRILTKSPFGILKYAMTLDGKIATSSGSSKWVTGPDSRQHVHSIRKSVDAIVVGGQTVRRDDPQLTARVNRDSDHQLSDGSLKPLRVVMTRSLDLPMSARLWNSTEEAETVVLVNCAHGNSAALQELRRRGVTVEEIPDLRPSHAMEYLYQRGALSVLWECGGALAAQAIQDGAVQKVEAFIAPKLVGGVDAPTPIASPSLCEDMLNAMPVVNRKTQIFENGDILVSGYLMTAEKSKLPFPFPQA